MLFRLMYERGNGDDNKNCCGKELENIDGSISDKKDKVEELNTKINDAHAIEHADRGNQVSFTKPLKSEKLESMIMIWQSRVPRILRLQ